MANFINVGASTLSVVQGAGTVVEFDLHQLGGTITGGSARFSGDNGKCSGNVSDTQVIVDVQWNGGPRGQYHGNLGLNGDLFGITFDFNNPGTQAVWHSHGTDFRQNKIQG